MLTQLWSACASRAGERQSDVLRRTDGATRRAPVGIRAILLSAMAMLAVSYCAHAHGIVGNRLFPGTLAFDDPAVADELLLPAFSRLKHPDAGGDVVDSRFGWSFSRLLTPTIAAVIEGGWIHRNWGPAQRSGADTANVGLKGLLFKNETHEIMISAGLSWAIGYSGAQGVGASRPDALAPGIFFGKGFGDLPDALAWLRPFGVTGAITGELPARPTSAGVGIDAASGLLVPMLIEHVETLHWGFSIQYSTYYLTSRFTGGPPKEEPLRQLVPLVEFAFDSPRGRKTIATMNPGMAYVANAWQLSAEAIVPLNREAGHGIGARAQLLLFLDDLLPSLFGKPFLSR